MSHRNIRIFEAAERGETTAWIAARFRLSKSYTRMLLRQARGSARTRAKVVSDLRRTWARKLVDKGFTHTEAAAEIGCARSTLFE